MRNDSTVEIHWSSTRVQYRAAVNCELVNTLTLEKTGNFLICRLLKTDSYVITHVMYRSEQFKTLSKCLTVKCIQYA